MFCIKSVFSRNLLSLFALLLVCVSGPALGAQEIDIGSIEVAGGGRNVISVEIASDRPEMRQLATRAFGAHGAFRVVESGAGSFVLTFRSGGGNRVELDISSGSPRRSQFRQAVMGTSPHNALYKAADLAVAKTTGQPGFFAGRLTFVGEGTGAKEVYLSDLFLTQVQRMTNDGSDSVGPRWSPDGQKILYTSYYRSGFPDIFMINVPDRRRIPFISVKGTNTGARFSPDGRHVAMVLSGEGNPEIYVSNANGKRIRRLTRTNGVESTPTWSPDGSRIAFASDKDGRPQLYVMSASGGNMRRIPTNISGYCAEPDWNPHNQNLLAFTAAVGSRFTVAVYDFGKRKSEFLVQGSADAIEPRWTNDGRHLIYTSRTADSSRLMLLDTVSGKTTALSGRAAGDVSQADFWIQ